MRPSKSPLRGSVTQNNVSARVRVREDDGIGFLARLGILAGLLLIVLAAIGWGWHVGWPQRQAKAAQEATLNLTRKARFSVRDIVVEGRHQSNKDDIFDALATAEGAPILSVDTQAAAARLGKLPWVGSVVVERRLPDTVAVILTERVPTARWQHDDHLYVIDGEGRVLPAAKSEDFSSLPLVVGTGAEREAQSLFALLKTYPDIREKTDSAVRVGERRWDLHLRPKVTVRLPEQDAGNALHRLSVLMVQDKILSRDIVAIDLRVPDRLTIEPAGAAQTGEKHP